ncbi:MAG: SGNH/GDSL hydrolase family protein [Victivallales bacterium]|nr:SGNH/GDSL hydrolase family protein [Victivallales bacterium]
MLDILPFVYGVHHLEKTPGGILLHRMSSELETFYHYNDAAFIRANCVTNVRLRFRTNSRTLYLKFVYGPFARPISCVDVLVEGAEPLCVDVEKVEEGFAKELPLRTNGEMRDVQVSFPHLAQIILQDIRLEEGACIEASAPLKGKMVFVGDSIFQGMTSSSAENSIEAIFGRKLGCDIHNIAVGGAVMQPDAVRLSRAVGGTMVAINFGVNDFAQSIPMAVFEQRTRDVVRLLAEDASNRKPYVVVPIPFPGENGPNKEGLTSEDYRNCIRKAVAEYPCITLVEGMEFYPNDRKYFIDSCHPNDAGAAIYAEGFVKAVMGQHC